LQQLNCYSKGAVWILSPRSNWIRAQRAQHNKFVESGLKN